MKVVILNTADAYGGAAIASWRLLHAQVGGQAVLGRQ